MKNIYLILVLFLLLPLSGHSQLIYSWLPGVNPGWTSSDGDLQWQNGCNAVTTNCGGNYSNNIDSYYTSPVIDASCVNGSTIQITFDIIGSAEYLYDFLFIEYSTNGGATWINPLGANVGYTGTASTLTTISLPILPASNNFRLRFNFDSDWIFNDSGYRITNFTINCLVLLPVELTSFTVEKTEVGNQVKWTTMSEVNNDYFLVQRSTNGLDWEDISIVSGAGNSSESIDYTVIDEKYLPIKNYYRLVQYDFDGQSTIFDVITVDNSQESKKILKTVNLMGQEVSDDFTGLRIVIYTDGTTEKKVGY